MKMKKSLNVIGTMILCLLLIQNASLLAIQSANITSATSGPPPLVEWSKTYGGAFSDFAKSLVQTSDGGYAMSGYSASLGGCTWLVKTDMYGNMQWNKTYEVTTSDDIYPMVQTHDGGFALAVANILIKTDEYGNMQWNKSYGESAYAREFSLVQTADDGFALAGTHWRTGRWDFWLVKTDSAGNLQWNKTYGEPDPDEFAYSLVQTSDGGYALAGYAWGVGAGYSDFWLVKTDDNGYMLWNKTYGGTGGDIASSVVQTTDGGYALVGYTDSFGAGSYDFWLVKTDTEGNMMLNKTYGGIGWEDACSLVQTSDGGYALAGFTASFGAGNDDAWLVKTDLNGNMQWNTTVGGTKEDLAFSMLQTIDGGYALAGWTNSFDDENADFWLVKLSSQTTTFLAVGILSPQNITYKTTSVPLTFTVNESISWIGCSLDGFAIVSIAGNITLPALSDGSHQLVVYASNSFGNMGMRTVYFAVDTIQPTANAGSTQTVNEDSVVTLDGSASTDKNGIATYTWAFTDLTPQTLSGKNPTYMFATPGTYTVTLEVVDPAGNTATDTVTIVVRDVTNPVAYAGLDRTVNEDVSTTLDGSGSTDNVAATVFTWTFTEITQKTLTGDKPTYMFSNPGIYMITLKVTDAAGNWATDTVFITVLDVTNPVANAGQDQK
jgi:PKD repeat protein